MPKDYERATEPRFIKENLSMVGCRSESFGRERIYDLVSKILYKFIWFFARTNFEKEM